MPKMRFKKVILLTGAGFTKNFGGYLGEEMWNTLFNVLSSRANEGSCPSVLKHLLSSLKTRNFNFEKVYQSFINRNTIPKIEKDFFTEAIFESYLRLDDNIRDWYPSNYGPSVTGYLDSMIKFINKFCGSPNEKGGFFTLNQDLFVERHFRGSELDYPSISLRPCLMNDLAQTHPVLNRDSAIKNWIKESVSVNNDLEGLNKKSSFLYIKLHGSFNWRTDQGKRLLIVGENKSSSINQIPFIKWYHQLFRKALEQEEARLLIIGYGFLDIHINKILCSAINEFGLKIYIVTVEKISDFFQRLKSKDAKMYKSILRGLGGYYQEKLLDIFPVDQKQTTCTAKNLSEQLFS